MTTLTAEQWDTRWFVTFARAVDDGHGPDNAAALADVETEEQLGTRPLDGSAA